PVSRRRRCTTPPPTWPVHAASKRLSWENATPRTTSFCHAENCSPPSPQRSTVTPPPADFFSSRKREKASQRPSGEKATERTGAFARMTWPRAVICSRKAPVHVVAVVFNRDGSEESLSRLP